MILQRTESSDEGTFGRLGRFYTVERPWKNNAKGISCIPAGIYKVRRTWSPRFKRRMFLVLDTSPREGIRIHAANLPTQLEGCIGLGLRQGWIDGKKAVLVSLPAIRQFEAEMPDEFELEVRNA